MSDLKALIKQGEGISGNSNKPHGFGVLNPATFTPFPKNPVISAFFREIHRADELGSGMRKMMRYGKSYGDADPEMIGKFRTTASDGKKYNTNFYHLTMEDWAKRLDMFLEFDERDILQDRGKITPKIAKNVGEYYSSHCMEGRGSGATFEYE